MAVNSVIAPYSERVGYVRLADFRFEWSMSNFHYMRSNRLMTRNDEQQTSPPFSIGFNNELKWYMKMYLNGIDECNRNYISLYVCFNPSQKNCIVRAKYKLSIVNKHGSQLHAMEISNAHTFVPDTNSAMSGFNDFIKQTSPIICDETLSGPLLTVVCEVKEVLQFPDVPDICDAVLFPLPEYRFADNLRTLFESKTSSDVTLTINGQEFRAHKLILALHSPVFFAMFEHEMAEKVYSEVKITDITPEVFKEMLRFMYTGEVQGMEKIAVFLLVVADKYALERLKAMCEEALCKTVNVSNAADMLILADKHSGKRLKSEALKFIASSTTKVMATPEFQSIAESYPHLLVEVLHELAVSVGQEAVV